MSYLVNLYPISTYFNSSINSIFFYSLYNFFLKEYDNKISINFTSCTHALFSSILGLLIINNGNVFLKDRLIEFSIGYFFYDIFICLNFYKGINRNTYIYHHLSTIYLLHLNSKLIPIHKIICLAELSNLPNYSTYYYLKNTKNNKNKLKISKIIQKTLFFIVRIPIMGYIVYDFSNELINNNYNLAPVLILSPLYLLGVMWSFKMCFTPLKI